MVKCNCYSPYFLSNQSHFLKMWKQDILAVERKKRKKRPLRNTQNHEFRSFFFAPKSACVIQRHSNCSKSFNLFCIQLFEISQHCLLSHINIAGSMFLNQFCNIVNFKVLDSSLPVVLQWRLHPVVLHPTCGHHPYCWVRNMSKLLAININLEIILV